MSISGPKKNLSLKIFIWSHLLCNLKDQHVNNGRVELSEHKFGVTSLLKKGGDKPVSKLRRELNDEKSRIV